MEFTVAAVRSGSTAVVAPGRRLRIAPAWDDDVRLCFDGASGDYWVLSTDAASTLERVMAGEGAAPEDSATLASLIEAGLLEAEEASGR